MENPDLHTKEPKKETKKAEYRTIRIPIGVSPSELTRLVELCQKRGRCPLTQKGVQKRKDSGREFYNVKGISQFIRDIVIPEYAAAEWQREQKLAELLKKQEETDAELRKLGVKK
ncbi:MAG: hypothetical protein NTV88_03600 [Candidatus Micrarchaeota archaeon]|nr:hypothetical protein [Candidatus Micrarchaeota archaeon]